MPNIAANRERTKIAKMNKLVIIGAGGHGRVAADIARLNGYSEIRFLDDNPDNKLCRF